MLSKLLVDDRVSTMNGGEGFLHMHHNSVIGERLSNGEGGDPVVHANQSTPQLQFLEVIEHHCGGMIIVGQSGIFLLPVHLHPVVEHRLALLHNLRMTGQ